MWAATPGLSVKGVGPHLEVPWEEELLDEEEELECSAEELVGEEWLVEEGLSELASWEELLQELAAAVDSDIIVYIDIV